MTRQADNYGDKNLTDRIAIIGGTGLETLEGDFSLRDHVIKTVFGDAKVSIMNDGQTEFVFLSRHGATHSLAPHEINYQANIAALVELGVTRAFATNAVGSLRLGITPGSIVIYDDFIDFTKNRAVSYWQNHPERPDGVVHTDFSTPYCPQLRKALIDAKVVLPSILSTGTYVCAEGPRFESPAEVRLFASWGGDIVGMTGLPEAVFAREAGICYAAVGIVTNFGAGLTSELVDHSNVMSQMSVCADSVREMILLAARSMDNTRNCPVCSRH